MHITTAQNNVCMMVCTNDFQNFLCSLGHIKISVWVFFKSELHNMTQSSQTCLPLNISPFPVTNFFNWSEVYITKLTILKCKLQWHLAHTHNAMQPLLLSSSKNFHHPKENTVHPLGSDFLFFPTSPKPLTITNLLLVSICLSVLNILHKWNHIICNLLCLAFFT